jgi:formate hydrogenlyase transcriptional activator
VPSTASQRQTAPWLLKNGPRELELLFRAIIYQPSASIVITDDDRLHRDVSSGAGRLLGLPREKIIGRSLDDFAAPALKPVIPERWQTFLEEGEQVGSLHLLGPGGTLREVEYIAKKNVLPARNLLLLRDKTDPAEPDAVPSWLRDYALFLLDADGRIVTWYEGAKRIYGYSAGEVIHEHASFLYSGDEPSRVAPDEEFKRALSEGHFAGEGWHLKKNKSRFWANAIMMALKDEDGNLQGFAGA